MTSWPSTVRVIRKLSSATTAMRISSATAMLKIFRPIEKRIAPPPSGRSLDRADGPTKNPVCSIARSELRMGVHCRRLGLLRRVPHQSRIEGLGREHGQDHDGTKREGAGARLD